MLGIRLHQGVQIDLHQGDLGAFVSDAMVIPCDLDLKPLGPVAESVCAVSGRPSLAGQGQSSGSGLCVPVLTDAGSLPSTHLIHVVMPKWTAESKVDVKVAKSDLKTSYLAALKAFVETGKRHVAVAPLAGEGAGLSRDESALIALATLRSFLDDQAFGRMRRISFVLSSAEEYQEFRKAMFRTFPEADQE